MLIYKHREAPSPQLEVLACLLLVVDYPTSGPISGRLNNFNRSTPENAKKPT